MIRHVCAGLALAGLLAAPAMAADCPEALAEIDAVLAQAPKVMVQWEEGDFDELPSIAVTHKAQTAPHGGIAVTVVENEDIDELPEITMATALPRPTLGHMAELQQLRERAAGTEQSEITVACPDLPRTPGTS